MKKRVTPQLWGIIGILISLVLPSFSYGDDLAYGLFNDGSEFGELDLTTGAVTDIGFAGGYFSGLGVGPSGVLYSGFNGGLFKVNTATGDARDQYVGGTLGGTGYYLGSTSNGLLYGLEFQSSNPEGIGLYSINPTTGSTSLIGITGITLPPQGYFVLSGLSNGSDNLYFAYLSKLYQLNTSTGAATLIGSMPSGTETDGIDFQDGNLYGVQTSPALAIDQFSISNGLPSVGPTAQDDFTSLTPYSVPEPATISLLAVVGIGGVLHRPKRLERRAIRFRRAG